jgi:HEAT repeat protein
MKVKIQKLIAITTMAIVLFATTTNLTSAKTTADPKVEYYLAKQDWDSLVKIGQPAIPRLIAALSDDDIRVRSGSIEALGQIGDRAAIESLVAVMKGDTSSQIRREAARTLIKLGYAPETIDEKVALYTVSESEEDLLKIGPAATSRLCVLLRKLKPDKGWNSGTTMDQAMFIVKVLGKIGSRDAVDTLIAVADGTDRRSSGYSNVAPDYPITQAVVEELGEIGCSSTFAVGDIKDLRSFTTKLIGKSDAVSSFLSERLDKAATDALAKYQSSDQTPRDLEVLIVQNLNAIIAGPSILGSDKMRFASVSLRPETKGLDEFFRPQNSNIARLNRLFLEDAYPLELLRSPKIGDPKVVDHLIGLLDSKTCGEVWNACARALAGLDDPRAAAPLGKLLVRPWVRWQYDTSYRQNVCNALVCLGTPSVDPLLEALKNDEAEVRALASSALGKIGDKRVVQPLCELLKDKEPEVRRAVVNALGKIGDKRVVQPLCELLKDKEPEVRRAVVNALGKLKDQRAIVPLISALKDQNSGVREGAAKALDELGWKP